MNASENQIVVYQSNETVRLDVRLENEVKTKEPPLQSIFYQNKFWDAKSLLIKFIRRAKKEQSRRTAQTHLSLSISSIC